MISEYTSQYNKNQSISVTLSKLLQVQPGNLLPGHDITVTSLVIGILSIYIIAEVPNQILMDVYDNML